MIDLMKSGKITVTPYVGVWIETLKSMPQLKGFIVTPYVGVWIETLACIERLRAVKSHPTWVCGLKHQLEL